MRKEKLYVDQYGNKFFARTVKELKEKVGSGKVSKMHQTTGKKNYHVGYVVGGHWLKCYESVEVLV